MARRSDLLKGIQQAGNEYGDFLPTFCGWDYRHHNTNKSPCLGGELGLTGDGWGGER